MFLKQLTTLNFKNYVTADLTFDEKVNCLVGNNGSGKTNLLDAIYYLAFSKSFFNPSDSQNILEGNQFFSIQGSFATEERIEKINCSIKQGHKKTVSRNGKLYERFADHIGLIPLVMISPIDILLIIEGSEVRRKWLDGIIAQVDRAYLDHLLKYNKALLQRNQLLKDPTSSSELVKVWNQHLIAHGVPIFNARKSFMEELSEAFNAYYKEISSSAEEVSMTYRTHLMDESDFETQLDKHLEKDLRIQYTTRGIHKDDIEFLINGKSLKKFASQGQQKSALLSLRLAQASLIENKKDVKPLMLLDDIYDKLDEGRMTRLFQLLQADQFGQLFITDTDFQHMNRILNQSGLNAKFFEVKNGEVGEMQEITSEI